MLLYNYYSLYLGIDSSICMRVVLTIVCVYERWTATGEGLEMGKARHGEIISGSHSLSKVVESRADLSLSTPPPPTKAQRTKWKPRQLILIDVLANGRRLRPGAPRMTLKQITKRVGCSRATIYKWLELPGFRQAVADRMVQFTEDRLPGIVNAMCDAAEEDRDVKAARFVHDDVLKKGTRDLSDLTIFEALYMRLGVTPTSLPEKE